MGLWLSLMFMDEEKEENEEKEEVKPLQRQDAVIGQEAILDYFEVAYEL